MRIFMGIIIQQKLVMSFVQGRDWAAWEIHLFTGYLKPSTRGCFNGEPHPQNLHNRYCIIIGGSICRIV